MRKYIILLGLACHLYSSYSQNPVKFNTADSTYVSGTITGYDGSGEFVSYFLTDWSGSTKKYLAKIDSSGSFKFSFLQHNESDFVLKYGVSSAGMYSKPGEKLTIVIDQVQSGIKYAQEKTYTVIGENNISNDINIFFSEYSPIVAERRYRNLVYASPTTIAKKTFKILEEDLKLLDEISSRRLLSNEFKLWAVNYLTYRNANYIAHLPFSYFNENVSIKKYVRFFKKIPVENPAAMQSSQYRYFLKNLGQAYYQISTYGDKFDPASDKYWIQAKKITTDFHSKAIGQIILHNIREKFDANAKYYPVSANMDLADLSSFEFLLSKQTKDREPAILNLSAAIEKHNASEKTKQHLLSKLAEHKGKYIVFDFWDLDCFSCLLEFPKYKVLVEEYEKYPVVFIFLSTETSDEEMLEVKRLSGINAEFYNLNSNESNLVNDVFSFYNLPARALISPEGNLIHIPAKTLNALTEELKRILQ